MAEDGGGLGMTQRELLLEVRDDLKTLRGEIGIVAREQAVAADRRASMQATATAIHARLDSHEKAIDDLQKWRDEAAGAMRLARWALGTSLLATILMVAQIVSAVAAALP